MNKTTLLKNISKSYLSKKKDNASCKECSPKQSGDLPLKKHNKQTRAQDALIEEILSVLLDTDKRGVQAYLHTLKNSG